VTRDSERIYDEFLVLAAKTADQPALSRLVARWQPRLFRYAWRVLGDSDQAKDVVQESWMDILRALGRLDDAAAFPAWAYRIVTRRCQRRFRRMAREIFESESNESESMTQAPESASGEFAAELSNVTSAIRKLPALQRAALALYYIEGLSVAEISIATDVPPGTVKSRLMHARRKVRSILKETNHEQD
jgi:RNA polymerase sigma factor (sigma-70 family)